MASLTNKERCHHSKIKCKYSEAMKSVSLTVELVQRSECFENVVLSASIVFMV